MNTCSTCKKWHKIRDNDYVVSKEEIWRGPHGACNLISDISQEQKGWLSVNSGYINADNHIIPPSEGLESWSEASLITQPDFGCILWEKKTIKTVNLAKIREAIANYLQSEGCNCCRGIDHDKHLAEIAKLLDVAMYKDNSGYNFNIYKS